MTALYSLAASDEPDSDNCYFYFTVQERIGLIYIPVFHKVTWRQREIIDRLMSPWEGRDPNEGGLI